VTFTSNVLPRRFGAGAPPSIFCPDCEQHVPANVFVSHREAEHPPSLKTISVPGVASEERHGYQTED
jgi:hypothetical protein